MRQALRSKNSTALAVIDDERVLLCRRHGQTTWRPVRARVIRLRPSGSSIMRVHDPLFTHCFLAPTPVVGHFAPPANKEPNEAVRIFIVRRNKIHSLILRPQAAHGCESDYIWHPLSTVEAAEFDVLPRELGPLLRGYVEGWIPDGPITLIE
jgi:hypothetical protein